MKTKEISNLKREQKGLKELEVNDMSSKLSLLASQLEEQVIYNDQLKNELEYNKKYTAVIEENLKKEKRNF